MHSSICNFILSCPNVARCHNFYITKLLSLLTWNCKNEVQKLCLSYGHPTESSTMRTRCEWHCLENVSKMSRKGGGKGEREVIVERAVTERATSLPNACLFAFKSGPPEQTKTSSVCYGEERRYELLQRWQSHRFAQPCYRTRWLRALSTQKQTKTLSVCYGEMRISDSSNSLIMLSYVTEDPKYFLQLF